MLTQSYDGDGLRGKKIENDATTYYVRSTVLGGAVVAELDGSGTIQRGYVYQGDQLLTVQQGGQMYFVHEDSVTKSKRITDNYGNVVSTIELDPWGANTSRSANSAFLPQSFTNYIRDANGGQDAMARRYSVGGTFAQPDPYGGSYDFSDPQSLNRYAYTTNDPVNRRDLTGLFRNDPVWWDWSRGSAGRLGGLIGHRPPNVVEPHEHTDDTSDPQKPGFQIGRFGFNANESQRLGRAYDKITSDNCRKFFDATLAALRQKGEIHSGFGDTPTTLSQTLSITTINKYSSNLTAKDVGVSQRSWAEVKNTFDNAQGFGTHASGVTLADGRIFLTDNAFYQAGAISQILYKDTDLSGVIVHELFHRAGLGEAQIRALHPEIQRNCGNPKDAL